MARNERTDANGVTIAKYKRDYQGIVADDPNNKDLLALTQASIESLKAYQGRPKYSNDAAGLAEFQGKVIEYFQYIADVNGDPGSKYQLFPDIEGLCSWLGITRKTLSNYQTRPGSFGEFVDLTKTNILAYRKQAASTYRIPSVLAIFDQVNNFDYRSVNEFKLTTSSDQDEAERERQKRLETELVRQLSEGGTIDLPRIEF